MQKRVNLVDLVKSFQTSIYLQIWRRYSRERASQSLPTISQKLEKKVGKNIGDIPRERDYLLRVRTVAVPNQRRTRQLRRATRAARRVERAAHDAGQVRGVRRARLPPRGRGALRQRG